MGDHLVKPHVHAVVFTIADRETTERVPCTGFLCGVTRDSRVGVSFVSAATPVRRAKS